MWKDGDDDERNLHVLWKMLIRIVMGLSLSKNGKIFFFFIHMRQPWRIFTGTREGATSRIATAPLDQLKVVLQVQTTRASIGSTIR
ncbi:hypothetical protein H5410_060310 [Solanum commersonii]|uniref:Uncharacterized protein n=1 Tax=Solanum commersonii TaxID=4109 RepID=A0A9J5W5N8_SOLCO|nr:hypothetical protein H5410_060310 [Solanum commersonii]